MLYPTELQKEKRAHLNELFYMRKLKIVYGPTFSGFAAPLLD